jgi:hypothetical protein
MFPIPNTTSARPSLSSLAEFVGHCNRVQKLRRGLLGKQLQTDQHRRYSRCSRPIVGERSSEPTFRIARRTPGMKDSRSIES